MRIVKTDDFQVPAGGRIWTEPEAWRVELATLAGRMPCDGCAWNTHFDAVRLERAGGGADAYVHRKVPRLEARG